MRIVFDLDNTLYSFGKTGIADKMHENIVEYIVQHLNMERDAAKKMSGDYYAKYGLSIAGLMRLHNVDPVHYCNFVHDIQPETRMKHDEHVCDIMKKLVADGHDIWILTNADMTHAIRLLTILGCIELFRSSATGRLKVIDCFAQWEYSKPEILNKPARSAYEHCLEVFADAEADGTCPKNAGPIMMIDDSLKNLEAPKSMGWHTVWVQHDVPTPTPEPDHFVIYDFYSFPSVMEKLENSDSKKCCTME